MTPRTAVISSTTLDLPKHRRLVMEACVAAEVLPSMMESLPAKDENPVKISEDLVKDKDVYIGIYAHRYGHVPPGYDISMTEIELDCALKQKERMEILVFLMDSKALITADMVESDPLAQQKLRRLKERASEGRFHKMFETPQELKGMVESALKDILLRQAHRRLLDVQKQCLDMKTFIETQSRRIVATSSELNKLRKLVAKFQSDAASPVPRARKRGTVASTTRSTTVRYPPRQPKA